MVLRARATPIDKATPAVPPTAPDKDAAKTLAVMSERSVEDTLTEPEERLKRRMERILARERRKRAYEHLPVPSGAAGTPPPP